MTRFRFRDAVGAFGIPNEKIWGPRYVSGRYRIKNSIIFQFLLLFFFFFSALIKTYFDRPSYVATTQNVPI